MGHTLQAGISSLEPESEHKCSSALPSHWGCWWLEYERGSRREKEDAPGGTRLAMQVTHHGPSAGKAARESCTQNSTFYKAIKEEVNLKALTIIQGSSYFLNLIKCLGRFWKVISFGSCWCRLPGAAQGLALRSFSSSVFPSISGFLLGVPVIPTHRYNISALAPTQTVCWSFQKGCDVKNKPAGLEELPHPTNTFWFISSKSISFTWQWKMEIQILEVLLNLLQCLQHFNSFTWIYSSHSQYLWQFRATPKYTPPTKSWLDNCNTYFTYAEAPNYFCLPNHDFPTKTSYSTYRIHCFLCASLTQALWMSATFGSEPGKKEHNKQKKWIQNRTAET